jgi:hypothetical protein
VRVIGAAGGGGGGGDATLNALASMLIASPIAGLSAGAFSGIVYGAVAATLAGGYFLHSRRAAAAAAAEARGASAGGSFDVANPLREGKGAPRGRSRGDSSDEGDAGAPPARDANAATMQQILALLLAQQAAGAGGEHGRQSRRHSSRARGGDTPSDEESPRDEAPWRSPRAGGDTDARGYAADRYERDELRAPRAGGDADSGYERDERRAPRTGGTDSGYERDEPLRAPPPQPPRRASSARLPVRGTAYA